MATRVGTGVTGSGPGTGSSIASGTKSTTTGNLLVAVIKMETGVNRNVSSIADTALNTWNIIRERDFSTVSDPTACLAYAENITGNAANVVTATLSGGAEFRQIVVEEFSGLATSSVLDGSYQDAIGSDNTFETGNITTTVAGLVVLGIGGFTSMTNHNGTNGNPDFSVGATTSDTFMAYLLSGSAQTVTPGAQVDESASWVAIAQAFKDVSTPWEPQQNAPEKIRVIQGARW